MSPGGRIQSFPAPFSRLAGLWSRRFAAFVDRECRLRLSQRVELVELGLQEFLVGQSGLVFRDQRGREGAGQRVLDDLVVLGRAQQNTDGWAFMGLPDIAVVRLEVEL